MPLNLPYSINPTNPVPVDGWSGPYTASNIEDAIILANNSIPIAIRFISLEVRLVVNNIPYKYWYSGGTESSNLVAFNPPLNLTTIGNSGSATYSNNLLNIPNYTLDGLGGQPLLNGNGFVKIIGNVINYDNSTYLTASSLINLEYTTNKNTPNGYAGLDGNGYIPISILPDSVVGNVKYKGTFNPLTTTFSATFSNIGWYYINNSGISATYSGLFFQEGDWMISEGTIISKVANTDAVMSVNGRLGNIVINSSDINIALGYTAANVTTLDNYYLASNPASYITASSLFGYLTSVALSGLTDVIITSPSNLQVLQYNTSSSKWVNATISTGTGFTDGSVIFSKSSALAQDNLNFYYNSTTSRLAIGAIISGVNLVPIMSGFTTGAYVVTTDSANNGGGQVWRVMGQTSLSGFYNPLSYIQIYMGGSQITTNSYHLSNIGGTGAYSIQGWKIQGSNNGTTFTDLDIRTSYTDSSAGSGPTYFNFNQVSSASFYYYRILFTSIVGGSIPFYCAVAGFGLYNSSVSHLNPSAKLHINTYLSSEKGLIIQGISGQSADLVQYWDSTNTVLSGINSSGKYYIQGGTSTQFLKANGSVDSSTYLTSNQTISFTPSGDISSTGGSGSTSLTPTISVTKILGNTIPANASGVLTNNGSGTLSWTTISASAGGSNTQVQFNNSGNFSGSSNLTWDNTNGKLLVGQSLNTYHPATFEVAYTGTSTTAATMMLLAANGGSAVSTRLEFNTGGGGSATVGSIFTNPYYASGNSGTSWNGVSDFVIYQNNMPYNQGRICLVSANGGLGTYIFKNSSTTELFSFRNTGNFLVGITSDDTINQIQLLGNQYISKNLSIGSTSSNTSLLQIFQPTTGIGTLSITTGTVTGTGTQFTNTFKIGDTFTANSVLYTISAISSDTAMTVSPTTNQTGQTYTLTGGSRFNVYGNGNISFGGNTGTIGGPSTKMWWDATNNALNIGDSSTSTNYGVVYNLNVGGMIGCSGILCVGGVGNQGTLYNLTLANSSLGGINYSSTTKNIINAITGGVNSIIIQHVGSGAVINSSGNTFANNNYVNNGSVSSIINQMIFNNTANPYDSGGGQGIAFYNNVNTGVPPYTNGASSTNTIIGRYSVIFSVNKAANPYSALVFENYTTSTGFTEKMRLDGNQLLIGTTSNDNINLLQVNGSTKTNSLLVNAGRLTNTTQTLTVTSNAVTMDCSLSNYFTITLPSSATCSFTFSNIPTTSQTITVQVTTGTSSLVSFPGTVKQPAGSSYVPTTTNGAIDIITFVTFGDGILYMVNTKNLS
jgi:hypothetical protein